MTSLYLVHGICFTDGATFAMMLKDANFDTTVFSKQFFVQNPDLRNGHDRRQHTKNTDLHSV